jgi:DNA (cytosine-5)-methyltransferase 1
VSKKLKVLDLFAGIGGFALGLDSTNFFKTVKFVEKDKYCQKVLRKNFPNIPIEEDIKNVKGKEYEADVIVGGFPCQPFSVAGKQKGTSDDRYLWPEMLRLIREIKPEFVIGENVQGIINLKNGVVLRQVQDDLESEGFEVQCFLIPASGIGAWHQRYRVWIVAHSQHNGLLAAEFRCNEEKNRVEEKHREENSSTWKSIGTSSIRKTDNGHEDVRNTNDSGRKDRSEQHRWQQTQSEERIDSPSGSDTISKQHKTENVSNTDTRLGIGENQEIQTRGDTVASSSSRGGEENVSNTEVIGTGEPRNINQEKGNQSSSSTQSNSSSEDVSDTESNRWYSSAQSKVDVKKSNRKKRCGSNNSSKDGENKNVSNTNSSLRGGGRTIPLGGENKVWRFRVEEEGIRDNIRIETVGRDVVSREDVSNTNGEGLQGRGVSTDLETKQGSISSENSIEEQQTWWQIESDLCGVPNGISYELDKDRSNRIKTLGNAIVPQIAREFGLAIKKVLSDEDII